MQKIYLLTGSNQQNPAKQLRKAAAFINKDIGKVIRKSSVYQTAAWGNAHQPDFLNQVIIITTKLDAQRVMQKLLAIEKKMGRIRTVKNAPRIIDIDILFYNKEIIQQPGITVPHLLLQQRRFALAPLNELSPQFKHPVFKKTIHQLLRICPDKLDVRKL